MLNISELDLDEFYIDEDLVEEYKEDYKPNEPYPPIIYDVKKQQIVDGNHRVNALHQIGIKKILGFVGEK